MKTTSVFVYGTLTSPQVVRILLGRNVPAMIPARLDGHSRHPVINRVYPGMLKSPAADGKTCFVNGCILADVTPKELELLDWFEADEYERQIVQVHTLPVGDDDNKNNDVAGITNPVGAIISAETYIWKSHLADKLKREEDWSYENFVEKHLESYLVQTVKPCREEMEQLGMT